MSGGGWTQLRHLVRGQSQYSVVVSGGSENGSNWYFYCFSDDVRIEIAKFACQRGCVSDQQKKFNHISWNLEAIQDLIQPPIQSDQLPDLNDSLCQSFPLSCDINYLNFAIVTGPSFFCFWNEQFSASTWMWEWENMKGRCPPMGWQSLILTDRDFRLSLVRKIPGKPSSTLLETRERAPVDCNVWFFFCFWDENLSQSFQFSSTTRLGKKFARKGFLLWK